MARKFIVLPLFIEAMEPGDTTPAKIWAGKPPRDATVLANVMQGEPIHVGYATQSPYGERQSLHLKNLTNQTFDLPLGKRAKDSTENVVPGVSDLIQRPARGKEGPFVYQLVDDKGEAIHQHQIEMANNDRGRWHDMTIVNLIKAKAEDAPKATGRTRATSAPKAEVKADDANAAMLARVQAVALLAQAGVKNPTPEQIEAALG